MKLHIKTFGCQMNAADSEEMSSAFARTGFELTDTLKEADAVVINTCTVRHHAEHRALSNIGRLKDWRNKRPGRILMVAGCAAQRLGKAIQNSFPFVDLVVGAKSIDRFPAILEEFLASRGFPPVSGTPAANPCAGTVSAYVTVMRGCSHSCSYCIVPSVRGAAICRPPEEILAEAEEKAGKGAAEIVLLGQTVNSYRHDSPGGKTINFAGLLRLVNGLQKVKRIRFMSPHPAYIDEEIIRAIAECEKAARHVHLPVQSGSDRILKLMKRGYTRAGFTGKTDALRKAVPDIALSTDFIVGFPSETPEDFRQTLSLAEEGLFSFAYCFKYSPRDNTPAAESAQPSSSGESEERLKLLLEAVRKGAGREAEAREGGIEEVLLETPARGRTSSNFWVRLEDFSGTPGETVKARICAVNENTLTGRIIK